MSEKVKINLSSCRYDIVTEAAEELGFEISRDENDRSFALKWMDRNSNSRRVSNLNEFQMINHFPFIAEISKREKLSRNMRSVKRIFPKQYSFYPDTFDLSNRTDFEEYLDELVEKNNNEDLSPSKNQVTFLQNSEASSSSEKNDDGYYEKDFLDFNFNGEEEPNAESDVLIKSFIRKPWKKSLRASNINIFNKKSELVGAESVVVQRYIENPLLMEKKKFDLRIYFFISSVCPLVLYMFKNGIVRVCEEDYLPPTTEASIKNRHRHITCLHSSDAKSKDSEGLYSRGNRRCFRFFKKWLSEQPDAPSYETIMERIGNVFVKSFICCYRMIKQAYKQSTKFGPKNGGSFSCFEVLGCDVMIDEDYKVHLLDVCHSPSYVLLGELDRQVKFELVRDTLKMLAVDPKKMKTFKEMGILFDPEAIEKERKVQFQRRLEAEMENSSFERIFPTRKTVAEYRKILEHFDVEYDLGCMSYSAQLEIRDQEERSEYVLRRFFHLGDYGEDEEIEKEMILDYKVLMNENKDEFGLFKWMLLS